MKVIPIPEVCEAIQLDTIFNKMPPWLTLKMDFKPSGDIYLHFRSGSIRAKREDYLVCRPDGTIFHVPQEKFFSRFQLVKET